MIEQVITVKLQLEEGQPIYQLVEDKPGAPGEGTYPALMHFFEDIGYKVASLTSSRTQAGQS